MTAQPAALPSRAPRTSDLALVIRRIAGSPRLWRPAVRVARPGDRPWVQLPGPAGVDLRLATWLPSQATDLHDHGGAACAFAVVQGAVSELRADAVLGCWSTPLDAPAVRVVEPGIVHRLRNDTGALAVTVHAYAPRLASTTRYELDGDRPVARPAAGPPLPRNLAC